MGTITTNEKKTIRWLQENGLYASEEQLDQLAEMIEKKMNELKVKVATDIRVFMEFQGTLIMMMAMYGIVYRMHEYLRMDVKKMNLIDGDVFVFEVESNKNTLKKARKMYCWAHYGIYSLLRQFLKIRKVIVGDKDTTSLWIEESGARMTETTFRGIMYKQFKQLDERMRMTPLGLRFLKSAHLFEKFRCGEINDKQMDRLCEFHDRTFSTWEKAYTFNLEGLERVPDKRMMDMISSNQFK
jgi:site-specific recombinase XerC